MSNVIQAEFGHPEIGNPQFFDQVFTSIKYNGIKRTERDMIAQGIHPSFARAAIRRIIRHRGW